MKYKIDIRKVGRLWWWELLDEDDLLDSGAAINWPLACEQAESAYWYQRLSELG